MKGYYIALAVALVLLVALSSGLAGYTVGKVQGERFITRLALARHGQGMEGPDMPVGVSRGEKFERMRELYREDPEKFRGIIEQRKEQAKRRLSMLKEKEPERYREIVEREINRLEERLHELREELLADTPK